MSGPKRNLDCPCCGESSFTSDKPAYDGDRSECGCASWLVYDGECEPHMSMPEDPCPLSAPCHGPYCSAEDCPCGGEEQSR